MKKFWRQPTLFKLWQLEFKNYSLTHFRNDLIAGLTVAAVALPLALAFGVAGGSTAAAGLVTAIIGGFVIGLLSGAPYQISGPTGAMSAVLVGVAQKYGLHGLWLAGLMAGVLILIFGVFKLGRIINFIPAPVITGFTSGIALIIFIGQIDNFLGITTSAAASSTLKVLGYFTQPLPTIPLEVVACGLVVMATMVILSRFKATAHLPLALLGIALATALAWGLGWKVTTIGTIPNTIILEQRYQFSLDDFKALGDLVGPAVAIAAIGSIESLLAGVVAGRMTGIKLNADQELVAQGIGNIVLPFFGGVPATAAIARISVGVKAGGMTRLVSISHSVVLLLSVWFLSAIIEHIPLAALAGVLMVTAWRMNEWHLIKFYFKRRLKGPIMVLLVTMAATVTFDLTQAIIIGVVLSLLLFINQVSNLEIVPTAVDWERLAQSGHAINYKHPGMQVVYISGALFFGVTGQLLARLESLVPSEVLILSMRGVSLVDISGLQVLEQLCQAQLKRGGSLYVTGLQPQVQRMFERTGLVEFIGEDKFFWSADLAITYASQHAGESRQAPFSSSSDNTLSEMPLGVVTLN